MKALDIVLPVIIIVLCALAVRRARKTGGCGGNCDGCNRNCGKRKN